MEKLRAEVRGEVTKSAEALRIASSQLALYSPEFLEKLKAFVQQAEQGYAQNATTLIIYLDAKRTYFGTLTDYYEALSKVAESRADLNRPLVSLSNSNRESHDLPNTCYCNPPPHPGRLWKRKAKRRPPPPRNRTRTSSP